MAAFLLYAVVVMFPSLIKRAPVKSIFNLIFAFSVLLAVGLPTLGESQEGGTALDPALDPSPLSLVAQLKLWESPQWHALLHCDKNNGPDCNSRAAEGMFVNPAQTDSAEIELLHAVKTLWSPEESKQYQCRFPARSKWIAHSLQAHGVHLSVTPCPDFQEWYTAISPHSAVVVFPTSFLNNPASAFGHTLLRFDRKDAKPKDKLISYTANYSASTNDEGALLYAYKGVFGGYFGYFSVAPYYDKVKLYSDLEDRDIWEYELTLAPEEVDLIVRHLWELRSVPFSYYYFDDNCSYQLLSLLEVGRPSLRLTDRFPLWVTPVDTLREIQATPDLVKGATFRPSLATALKHRTSVATSEQITWAKEVIRGELPLTQSNLVGLQIEDQAVRLELAYDMATYATVRHSIDEDLREKLSWDLLSQRSRLRIGSPFPDLPTPEFKPHDGHHTVKMSAGFGMADDISYGRFSLRPSFHDHADNPKGYLPGSQIKFVESIFRYQGEEGVLLERLDLLDAESLAPRQPFYAPISWSLRVGAHHGQFNNVSAPFVYSVAGGPGATFALPRNALLYGLMEIDAQGSKNLDLGWSLGGGPKTGVQLTLIDGWRVVTELQATRYFAGDLGTTVGAKLIHDIPLSERFSLRISSSHATTRQQEETQHMVELVYFGNPTL